MKPLGLLIGLTFLLGCSTHSERPVQCHIVGTVVDRPESEVLELYTHIDGEAAQCSRPVARIEIHDGKFAYDLRLDAPDYCTLSFSEEKARGSWRPIHFIVDGDTLRLTLYPEEQYERNRVEGEGATAEFERYKAVLSRLDESYYEETDSLECCGCFYTKEYAALIERFEAAEEGSEESLALFAEMRAVPFEDQLSDEMAALTKAYQEARKAALLEILDHEPTIARYALLAQQMAYSLPDQELLDLYEQRYAGALEGHYLAEYCRRQLAGLRMGVGSRYVDFEAPDLVGKMHRFSELIQGAELVLLDLWASWCAPCRRGSKALIPLYEQYKEQGFRVVGVAREAEDLVQLRDAIEQDGYPWIQLVELDDRIHLWAQYGRDNAAGGKFLLDKEGTILAIDPSVEELKSWLDRRLNVK